MLIDGEQGCAERRQRGSLDTEGQTNFLCVTRYLLCAAEVGASPSAWSDRLGGCFEAGGTGCFEPAAETAVVLAVVEATAGLAVVGGLAGPLGRVSVVLRSIVFKFAHGARTIYDE